MFCEGEDGRHYTVFDMASHIRKYFKEELQNTSLMELLSLSTMDHLGLICCALGSESGPEDSPDLVEHVQQHNFEFGLRSPPWPQPPGNYLKTRTGGFSIAEDSEKATHVLIWTDKLEEDETEHELTESLT